jgi:predicted permease
MNLLQDLKFALRSLRAHRGAAALSVATLAVGLGAALALYAVIDAVLLRELPYPQSERLVRVRELAEDGHAMALAYPNYTDLAASSDAFEATSVYVSTSAPVTEGSAAQRLSYAIAGTDFFRVLGVAPQLGRTFEANEHGVAVISHALWQGLLHGRTDVLGRPLKLDGEDVTVVGVMPAGFAFPRDISVWRPVTQAEIGGDSRTAHNWSVIGRLRSADGLGSAQLAAHALALRLKQQYGSAVDAAGFELMPLAAAIAAPVREALLLLAAGVGFLLLIAITNATNFLLALNAARARELAVRAALGASRLRIARQIFVEGALIATAACLIALALAAAAIRVLVHSGGANLPRAAEIGLSAGTAVFALLATFVIAVVTTLSVLWSQGRNSTIADLRESGRGQSPGRSQLRMRAALLVGQTALTTMLLVGAGLLGRSFLALLAIDPGFVADSAVSVQLSQPGAHDPAGAAAIARRYEDLIATFSALPGVSAVGGANVLPLSDDGANGAFWDGSVTSLADAPTQLGYAEFRVASAGYFDAAGIRLLRGRLFDDRDHADGEQVALISAAAARATWGERDPIGQRIQYGNMDGDMHPLTIVGVVGDVSERRLDSAPMGSVYVNLAQRPAAAAEFNLVVRSSLPLASLTPQLRDILQRRASDIPYSLAPLAEVRASALADRRFSLTLLGAFAAIAFTLAAGGLYGLMAFAVGQREHEFALRQALGASRAQVAKLVLGHGLMIGGIGIAAGLVLSLAGSRAVHGLLYGVSASDPLILIGVAALLLGTIALACLLPARRACTVAPREALS